MPKKVKIRKGLNIPIQGKAEKILSQGIIEDCLFALKPTDFPSVTPKLLKKEGENVLAGESVFYDKANPEVQFCSPVSGVVKSIIRGERRKILEVVIEPAKEQMFKKFETGNTNNLPKEKIIEILLSSGTWPFIRQRPFNIIAKSTETPKAIFISGFDSSPLAPDYDFVLQGQEENFKAGVEILKKLTDGKLHINVNGQYPVAKVFSSTNGTVINEFTGPHPAGNVGVQIHHIDAVNKDEVVWFVNPQDVAIIGKLFTSGEYHAQKVIALTGSEVSKPQYYRVKSGCAITPLVKNNVSKDSLRYISGNVLTGTQIDPTGYLGFYHNQFTVIPEGKDGDFMGWIAPGLNKFSVSRTFFSWLMPGKEYKITANTQGGLRPFTFSEEYEKVLPMDILPVHLLKSIIIEDIDQMEALGIYEVAEEDFALCEFVCTSKIEVQKILRQGFDMMIKELG
jgi:Na+-transporting NADH:ubiquinone oxidoreductase subunit A